MRSVIVLWFPIFDCLFHQVRSSAALTTLLRNWMRNHQVTLLALEPAVPIQLSALV